MIKKELLAKKELSLSTYDGEDKMISSHELAETLKDNPKNFSYSTGVGDLDRILGNVEAGELIVVTGPTGHGKTTLLMHITKEMAKQNIFGAWFSLEVTPRQFIQKLTFGGKQLPLFYTPAKNTDSNIQWLISRIIEAKMKYKINTVFIDHLHQMFSVDKFNGKNLSLELGDIVAKIKAVAIEYDLAIFLIAHCTDDKTHTLREPKITDIRDSGMISRLADTVLGVWRIKNGANIKKTLMEELDEHDTWAKVRVWKNRRTGKLGMLVLNHANHGYEELDTLRLLDDQAEKENEDKSFNRYAV